MAYANAYSAAVRVSGWRVVGDGVGDEVSHVSCPPVLLLGATNGTI